MLIIPLHMNKVIDNYKSPNCDYKKWEKSPNYSRKK